MAAEQPEVWDKHFGFVADLTGRAVVVGEFGGFYTFHDKEWNDAFVGYLIERGFGAFFFCLNPDSTTRAACSSRAGSTSTKGS